MPAAFEVLIGDAVVSELNDPAREWTQAVAAERIWLPVFKAEELKILKVSVCVLAIGQNQLTRVMQQFKYGVAVDFQKMVDPRDVQELDRLTMLVEQVHDFFRDSHPLATLPDWTVRAAEREDIYDLERLDQHNTFESLVALTVEGKK